MTHDVLLLDDLLRLVTGRLSSSSPRVSVAIEYKIFILNSSNLSHPNKSSKYAEFVFTFIHKMAILKHVP